MKTAYTFLINYIMLSVITAALCLISPLLYVAVTTVWASYLTEENLNESKNLKRYNNQFK